MTKRELPRYLDCKHGYWPYGQIELEYSFKLLEGDRDILARLHEETDYFDNRVKETLVRAIWKLDMELSDMKEKLEALN